MDGYIAVAPVFCIWMLAFTSFRLSKFDTTNVTRGLRYLRRMLAQTFQMKRDRFANKLFNFRGRNASCDTGWYIWRVCREIFTSPLNVYCVLHK